MTEGHLDGHAEGHGRVYQAARDLNIVEYHLDDPSWESPDSVRHAAVGRPPVILRDRTQLTERLRAAVAPGMGNQIYVLHGMGGCGKTALAHSIFSHAIAECDRIGLWINASDRGSLRAGMLAVAADRGASQGELVAARAGLRAAADLVWDSLNTSEETWLLVLDNADDPEILRGGWLRASPRGVVLITSRRGAASWWPGAQRLPLGTLPRQDAAQVLCDLAPETGTIEEAAEIADRLGNLPLALTLAGGFLAHQLFDPQSMVDYRDSLDTGNGLDLIEETSGTEEDSRHLLGRTWQLSLDALTARGHPEATQLLRLLACWSSDPLPLSLFAGNDLGPGLPRPKLQSVLQGLLDHSLTELSIDGIRCLRTHPVVLDIVARGIPLEEREPITALAARMLDDAVPTDPQRGSHEPLLQLIAPHVITMLRRFPRTTAALSGLQTATRLATALHRRGEYLSACELATEAATLMEPILGGEHPLLLAAHTRRGRSLFRLGHYAEAERIQRRVLNIRERLLGPDHPATLESCFALQLPLHFLDNGTEALDLLHRAAAGRERALGPEHPLTLYAHLTLLEFLPRSDPATEALSRRLPNDCERCLGADHPVTLAARLNSAQVLLEIGRADEAEELARLAAAEHEQRYGPDYPITINAQGLYARIQAALGDFSKAADLMEAVVQGRIQTLGSDHPWTRYNRDLLNRFRLGQPEPVERW
ncbi:tetratricopeptide repeat protein [Streptomyces sp. NPDC004008]